MTVTPKIRGVVVGKFYPPINLDFDGAWVYSVFSTLTTNKTVKITAPDYRFCPFCKCYLKSRTEEGDKVRRYCSVCNWVYFPVVAYTGLGLVLRDSQVLMVKRARDPHRETWMFPAGFAEYGEHPLETTTRELKEELAINVTSSRLMDIYQSTDDNRAVGHLIIVYLVDSFTGQEINMDPKENLEIGWHDLLANSPPIGFRIHRENLWPCLKNYYLSKIDGK